MKIKKLVSATICGALLVSAVSISGTISYTNSLMVSAVDDTITINPLNTTSINNGKFQGWGTSLCWYGNRIGYSEKTTEQSAELLYNAETGLGLNIIRYNIGGGDDPTHNHITRTDSKMPGYWTNYDSETGSFEYDFSKDENQRNVLLKSLEECPDMIVEMFSNSPPYFMTNSGCTSGTNSEEKGNLPRENYNAFAKYMATVIKHYKEDLGINVSSVEPMNEPSNGWNIWGYGAKQEGCSFEQGESQSEMLIAMNNALKKFGLTDVDIAGCDETNVSTALNGIKKLSDEALSALNRIDVHTYSSGTLASKMLNDFAYENNKNLWMSESDGGDIAGTDAGEMSAALAFANRISNDFNNLRPSAWIMWQAIGSYCSSTPYEGNNDPATLNQSELDTNGFWGVCYADMDNETVVKTKKYYGFGQYTRFIRPGDTLIASEWQNTVALDKDGKQLKIVVVNTKDTDKTVRYDLSNFKSLGSSVKVVRTSGDMKTGENWAELSPIAINGKSFDAPLKANSITTFVIDNAVPMSESEINDKNNSKPISSQNTKPSSQKTAAKSQSNTKHNPVVNAKTDAKKIMDKAKIKNLTAKSKNKKITVKWKKVSGAKGYEVQIAAKKTFKKPIVDKKSVKKNKITIKNKKLKKGKTYFVRVRAFCTYKNAKGITKRVNCKWNKKTVKVKVK